MKKRVFSISLLLVVCLVMLVPSAVMAKNDRNQYHGNSEWTEFTGGGNIYVSDVENMVIRNNTAKFSGEIVQSLFQPILSDWDLLNGAIFWSDHDSTVRLYDDGTARGVMNGTFTMTSADGESCLSGVFSGTVTGSYTYMGDQLVFTYVQDEGRWNSTRGNGAFENIRASGEWAATLTLNLTYGTLVGALDWAGSYLETGRH